MSTVLLNTGKPTVDIETTRAIAARSNVALRPEDEEHYRFLLDAFDATAEQVAKLPAYQYAPPELGSAAGPDTAPRRYWKEADNPLNGWSHRAEIRSSCPSSNELAGRTVAVKDNISVRGLPITGGTFPEMLTGGPEHAVAQMDAVVVARLLQAGATIAGTSTCEQLSMTPLSYTSASGPVHNAWRRGWTSGGSSSGSGSLVGVSQVREWRRRHGLPDADGELGPGVDMALGGDQGGSIRIPAAYNGVYGLKPTHGLVPYTGILSLNPMIDHTGPICKSLEDMAVLLKVLAGYDGVDPRMTPDTPRRDEVKDYPTILADFIGERERQGEWTPALAGKGIRVGVVKESFDVLGLTAPVKDTVRGAIQRFRDIGATVDEVSIPLHLAGPSIWTIATRVGIATYGFQNHPLPLLDHPVPGISPPPFDQKAYEILTRYNPAAVTVHLTSDFLTHHREASLQAKAIAHAHQLRNAYDAALHTHDVLLTPLNPTTGSSHPSLDDTVQHKAALATGATSNTCQFNITGHPALAVPIGFSAATAPDPAPSTPVAMQLIGRRFEDEAVIKAAAAWEVPGKGIDTWDGRPVGLGGP